MLIENLESLIIAALEEGLTAEDIRDIVNVILNENETSNIKEKKPC